MNENLHKIYMLAAQEIKLCMVATFCPQANIFKISYVVDLDHILVVIERTVLLVNNV